MEIRPCFRELVISTEFIFGAVGMVIGLICSIFQVKVMQPLICYNHNLSFVQVYAIFLINLPWHV